MSNVVRIDGRETPIVNPDTNLAIMLEAVYNDQKYDLSKVTGSADEEHAAVVLHFTHEDRKTLPDRLNGILLMTDLKGKYDITGVCRYDQGDGKPEGYILGDDRKVEVSDSADKAIRNLRSQLRV